ncbi:MAG: four helix bundle protein [Phycisphaerales bacterium]|nr:four helix bundle protein [Phycisphaerales bacterium]
MAAKRSNIQRFEDLKVWQAGQELVNGVYRAARTQALRRDFGLVGQMTRAAVSITSNVAEGHEHGSRVQYIEYCFRAKASAGELRSQVINAHDVELIDEKAYAWLYEKCQEVSKMLAGYIKHLVETANAIPGMKYTRAADRNRASWEEFLAEHGIGRLADGSYACGSSDRGADAN